MTKKINIAINGFGRIGRLVLRAISEQENTANINVVAINDLSPPETNAHLFKYDSIHGVYNRAVVLCAETKKTMDIGFGPIKILQERDPAKLPWSDLGVDLVLECSGIFTSKEAASKHLKAGAKKVIISAPSADAELTVVYGVNHQDIAAEHNIISNASCTTNCLAPVAKVLHEACGIKHGFMTTIHAYTGDQRIIDTNHKDLRRSRAAGISMIPTSTGAARAVGLVLPELKGKIDGTAIRVPTPNVSVVDFKFTSNNQTSIKELNAAVLNAANGSLKGILSATDLPLVSIDFNHNPHSSIIDLNQTQVIEGSFCRVLSWYDNEWGFANRMVDVTRTVGQVNSL